MGFSQVCGGIFGGEGQRRGLSGYGQFDRKKAESAVFFELANNTWGMFQLLGMDGRKCIPL